MTPLAQLLARLPRVGEATAARLAASIAEQPDDYRLALARAVEAEGGRPGRCPICGDELGATPPDDCGHDQGHPGTILVVATPAARRVVSKAWRGRFHVLGALLPDGVTPGMRSLLERCREPQVQDVVLAFGPSPKARATELWLAGALRPAGVDVWAIGQGVGYGRELEDADREEIVAALTYRRAL